MRIQTWSERLRSCRLSLLMFCCSGLTVLAVQLGSCSAEQDKVGRFKAIELVDSEGMVRLRMRLGKAPMYQDESAVFVEYLDEEGVPAAAFMGFQELFMLSIGRESEAKCFMGADGHRAAIKLRSPNGSGVDILSSDEDVSVIIGPQDNAVDIIHGFAEIEARDKALEKVTRLGDAALDPLIAALEHENENVRHYAAEALGELGNERAVEPLVLSMADTSERVRHSAVFALTRIEPAGMGALIRMIERAGEPSSPVAVTTLAISVIGLTEDARAVPPLIRLATAPPETEGGDTAQQALILLGRIAVPGLIEALESSRERTRKVAADLLGSIDDRRAVAPLLDLLDDKNVLVRLEAIESLGEIGDPQALQPLVGHFEDKDSTVRFITAYAVAAFGAAALESLEVALRDTRATVRECAVIALSQIDNERVVALLASALGDSSTRIRERAVIELGRRADVRAVPYLRALLNDPDAEVRLSAASSLAHLGDRSGIDILIEAISNPLPTLREQAVHALSSIPGPPAASAITIAAKDTNERVRVAAARALAAIGDGAVPMLLTLVTDTSWPVREAAGESLAKLGAASVPGLLTCLENEDAHVRRVAARALGEIGSSDSVDELILSTRDEDEGVRVASLTALERIGDQRALEPIKAAARDGSVMVRMGAVAALGKFRDSEVIGILHNALSDEEELVRRNAVRALGTIGGEESVQAVVRALNDESWLVVQETVCLLGRIGDETVVEALLRTIRDRRVTAFVIEALAEIGDRRAIPAIQHIGKSGLPFIESVASKALKRFRDGEGCLGEV